jgi:two-component system phosphate regulon sensor histidine kinase PhoR
LLLFLVLAGLGFSVAKLVENSYKDMVERQLLHDADMVVKSVGGTLFSDAPNLQERIREWYGGWDVRVTIIDKNGKVLADSSEDPEKMENHRNRPEIRAIFDDKKEYGMALHRSQTLGYKMMYVARPVYDENGETKAAVRTAISLKEIGKVVDQLWLNLAIAMGIAFLFSGIIGIAMARGITRPVEEITRVAKTLVKKDYSQRVAIRTKGELKELSDAMNLLAESLQSQMEEIYENQQRLSGILNNMASGVMLTDLNHRIVLVNPAMENMIGIKEKDLIGKFHIAAGKSFGLSQLINRSLTEGKSIHEEVHVYFPKERILDVYIAPHVNIHGEKKGVITVLHDITNIRRLEKMRSEFVANVSHELKTPVTSLIGFTETLLDGAMYDEEVAKKFLKIIHDESVRLNRLISDILLISKVEQEGLPLKLEEIDMVSVIEECVDTVQEELTKKQLQLSMPERGEVRFEADRDRLKQIILNLVSNAIMYTPPGGKIRIDAADRGEEVHFVIEDTGIGIAKKDIPRIFERFYRVDKARSRNSGGTGLGLAIVKHLVESHHGKIHVESEPGVGSKFTIVFPKKQNRIG